MKFIQGLLIAFLISFLPQISQATHIVGGEMNYTCLGNDQYEITLSVYRDCFNGVPWFDSQASIGVFNQNNVLVDHILIPLDNFINDTLETVLSNDCLVALDPVCVHTTTYTTIVTLPFMQGGYQLVYQRCCRNNTIANIILPDSTGATYMATITEKSLLECNSNAKFKDWPPVFICVNEPINFDHSALDQDGDSIVYRLCTPLEGATPNIPQPQPPNNPPYQNVIWNPPYSENDMLGGIPLEIDPVTGLLTGTPNVIGQFVVGVCADEYRDGELISTTRRDFQYNVGLCGTTTSSFFSPDFQCGDFTVDFNNQSINADEFVWYFNDPNNPGASSPFLNPSYTYSDTGSYTIMLVAEPNNSCRDTSYETVSLYYNSLVPDFGYDFAACSDSLVLEITDLSTDSISTILDWYWELDLGLTTLTSTDQHPVFDLFTSQTITLTLTVTAENGCEETIAQSFPVELLEDELFADTVQICKGQSVWLNPDFLSSANYNWTPVIGLDDPMSPNPIASPDTTTTYTVTISDNTFADCQIVREITVEVAPPILVEVPNDTTTCEPTILLTSSSNFGVNYIWASDSNFTNILGNFPNIGVTPIGEETYYLKVIDPFGCESIEEVTIIGNGINAVTPPFGNICEGDSIQLMVNNLDNNDILTYNWSPPQDFVSSLDIANPTVFPSTTGIQTYYVEMENQHGCTLVDSIQLGVIDTTDQAGFVSFQQCSGYSIFFTNTSVNAPFYHWNFGDPSAPGAGSNEPNPVYTYNAPGVYDVLLTVGNNLECPDTIHKQIEVFETLIEVNFDWVFEECSDSVVIQFNDLSINNQSDFTVWDWQFSNGQSSSLQNPTVSVLSSQNLEVSLALGSDDGCMDTLVQTIPIELIEVDLLDTLTACPNIPVELNPTGNVHYEYLWTPSMGLDDPTAANPIATIQETTNYSVAISTISGNDTCEIHREITLYIPPTVDLTASPDTSICVEEIAIFASSTQANTIGWSETPNPLDIFANTDTIIVEPARPSVYYVFAQDASGCFTMDSVVVFNYVPDILVQNDTLCTNDTLQLFAENLYPEDSLTFVWEPQNAIVDGANTSNPLVNPSITTNFTVTANNQFGCKITESVEIFVNDVVPILNVNPVLDTIFDDESIQIMATQNPNYTYNWTPSNILNFNNIHNPIASPTETTVYIVNVEDTETGCSNSREVVIVVFNRECAPPQIFVPSGFTPNGDGKNDFFEVFGNQIDEMELFVYDRWGEKIFEAHSQSEKWDGSYKGSILPPDVFGYYLRVKCFGGEEYFEKGNVTLLR